MSTSQELSDRVRDCVQAAADFGWRISDISIKSNGAVRVSIADGYDPADLRDQMNEIGIPPAGTKRPSIYFLKGLQTGHIKIGYSHDVRNRMMSLRTSCSERLQLLLVVPGNTELESKIHRALRHWRVNGEWFSDSEDVLWFIDRCRHGDPSIVAETMSSIE